ncbi:competence protein ComEA [Tessaracoccus bendigoensis DSM 12906]|uniref:Competence protein ComEA n=1 Tax=Tessaracoccus bendigoensis DSM 12906 TaxID=1123357 RepID=A0A1M6D2Q5_9ACTN|nr:ComEA family DNA-binding protein [Tessaracoccus bendigoensis]SHI67575.1 competence protein ComEA [Tessaracoccus bendigoensis DSM 12906]
MQDSDELARARLAFISAGRPPLGAPRRAVEQGGSDTPPDPGPGRGAPGGPAARVRGAVETLGRFITVKHALVVGALMLVAVAFTVFALGQSSATVVPVDPVVRSVPPTPSAPVSSAPPLRVHVAGAVVRPGVVSVPAGSIVQDAIVAAGGLAADAGPAELNLAAPVTDGMQILIGSADDPRGEVSTPGGSGPADAGGRINLNTASPEQLEELPGIGPVTAAAIVAWRDEHGGFTAVEELQEVSGIGPKTFEKLASLVTT